MAHKRPGFSGLGFPIRSTGHTCVRPKGAEGQHGNPGGKQRRWALEAFSRTHPPGQPLDRAMPSFRDPDTAPQSPALGSGVGPSTGADLSNAASWDRGGAPAGGGHAIRPRGRSDPHCTSLLPPPPQDLALLPGATPVPARTVKTAFRGEVQSANGGAEATSRLPSLPTAGPSPHCSLPDSQRGLPQGHPTLWGPLLSHVWGSQEATEGSPVVWGWVCAWAHRFPGSS